MEKSESVGNAGFAQSAMQLLMQSQSGDCSKDVDLVKTIGLTFIEITESMEDKIFEQITLVDVLEQLLITLTMLVEGQCTKIQLMLANWDQLQRTLSFYLNIDFK